jgi:hypothetical protein
MVRFLAGMSPDREGLECPLRFRNVREQRRVFQIGPAIVEQPLSGQMYPCRLLQRQELPRLCHCRYMR